MPQLLGGWTPRDTAQQLQRVTRHSSFVTYIKYALVLLAVGLVVAVFVVPALHDSDEGARLVFTNIPTVGDIAKPRMETPRFQGLDEDQQPYNIKAEYAERQEDGSILMHKPDADITLQSGAWIAILAEEGIYNAERKNLAFPGKVEIFHDEGYQFTSRQVNARIDQSVIYGEQPVVLQGPMGTLTSTGFRIDTRSKTMNFFGGVSVHINRKKD